MVRLTPHAQAAMVPQSSGAGACPAARAIAITPSSRLVLRSGWMS